MKTRVPRPVHPDKDIEAAVSFAEAKGLAVIPSSCHDGVDYFIQAAGEVTASCQCTRPCLTRLLMLATSAGE